MFLSRFGSCGLSNTILENKELAHQGGSASCISLVRSRVGRPRYSRKGIVDRVSLALSLVVEE